MDVERCQLLHPIPSFLGGGTYLCDRLLNNPCAFCKIFDEHKDEWSVVFGNFGKRVAVDGDI